MGGGYIVKKLAAICVVAGLVVGAMSAYGAGPDKGKPAVKSGKAASVVKGEVAKSKPKAVAAKPKPKDSKPGMMGRRGGAGRMGMGMRGRGHGGSAMRGRSRMHDGQKGGRGLMKRERAGRGAKPAAKKPEPTKTK
jgi:hypothetical protein